MQFLGFETMIYTESMKIYLEWLILITKFNKLSMYLYNKIYSQSLYLQYIHHSMLMDFKLDWKNFQRYICWVKEHALRIWNILCLKSLIKGHRNGKLGSIANSAWIWPVWLSCLLAISMAFNVRFETKCILNPWSILFHPVKILLKVFSILFKVHSVCCGTCT